MARIIQDQKYHKKTEESTSINIVPVEAQSLQSRNAHFLWFLLYIEVVIRLHHSEDAKQELVEMCRNIYADNPHELANITLFEREYTSDKAIWWYTLDSFLYRIVNKALRSRDFDLLFALRFFMTDLAHALESQYEQFLRVSTERDLIKVFRGQYISNSELELMLDNVHEFISMNSFLSTSSCREKAVEFLQSGETSDGYRHVLFEITIDPRLPVKPFADIKEFSYFKGEDEVLITFGALFRIENFINNPKENFHIIELSLVSDTDYRLKKMYDYLRSTINHEYTLDSLGKILHEMGEYQHALKCYDRMMHETRVMLANCHMGIGRAMYGITSYDNALKHYEASLTIRKNELGENNSEVGINYSRVGAVLCRKGEMRRSLETLDRAKTIQEKTIPSNSIELAETYNSLGLAHFTLNNTQQAEKYFQKTLDIRLQVLPEDHPAIGFAYNNLSRVLETTQRYEPALEYAKKALNISLKTLPKDHPDVEQVENNIRKLTKIVNPPNPKTLSYDESMHLLLASLGMD